MTDADLLHRLAAADAALPPGPGAPFSPARLQALAARRTARHALLGLAAVLLVGLGALLARTPVPGPAPAGLATELRALRADLARVQRSLHDHLAAADALRARDARAAGRHAAASRLRCELAEVRAGAALAHATSAASQRTHR